MQRYFFILGRQRQLCFDELKTILVKQQVAFSLIADEEDFVIVETKIPLDCPELISRLAGTIKIGELIGENIDLTAERLIEFIGEKTTKIFFGISTYNTMLPIVKIGQAMKQALKKAGVSARFVTSKVNPLSSVIVEKNKMLKSGAEICILKSGDIKYTGITRAVQPFEKFSEIDYGRPARDAYSGMLPPKLAQTMINLSGANDKSILYDPFCGSGTVLQQALLLGFNEVIGSDLSEKAIADTKTNLAWLEQKFNKKYRYQIFQSDIKDISQRINAGTIDTIVAEPSLGPPLRGKEPAEKLKSIIDDLTNLYKITFAEFDRVLRKKGTIVMVIPQIEMRGKIYAINIKPILPKSFSIRNEWLYQRENQFIQRRVYKIVKE